MLSTAASNALLKTLEEPPGHVVFVLATTDAQKVLPTIRSRTQHFEFRLLGSETLSALLHQVRSADGSGASRRGARRRGPPGPGIGPRRPVGARPGGRGRASSTTTSRCWPSWPSPWPSATPPGPSWPWPTRREAGRDPQRLAADLAEYLRQGFLAIVAGELVSLSGADRARVEDTARRMGLPALVRALEELGRAQVDMRDIPDQRVHLEVALIKLTHPQADDSTTALLERVERLERALAEGGGAGGGRRPRPSPPRTLEVPPRTARRADSADAAPAATARASQRSPASRRRRGGAAWPDRRVRGRRPGESGPDLARRTLGAVRRQSGSSRRSPRTLGAVRARRVGSERRWHRRGARRRRRAPTPERSRPRRVGPPARSPRCRRATSSCRSGATACSPSLPNRARARFRVGRFVDVDGVDGGLRAAQRDAPLLLRGGPPRRGGRPGDALRDGGAHPTRGRRRRLRRRRRRRRRPAAARRRARRRRRRCRPRRSERLRLQAPSTTAVTDGTGGIGDRRRLEVDDAPDLLDPAVLAAETEPAGAGLTPEERLKQAFPGAQEV